MESTQVRERVRFFKKVCGTGHGDKFIEIRDCGHNRWQSGRTGHLARHGFMRMFGGQTWRSMQHCAACSGGGVWKLRW